MLANQPQQIEIFFRSLLYQFLEHLRLGVGTENEPDLFVPSGIDLVQFTGAGVNEFLERAPLLLHARDWQLGALEGIQDTQQVLALAKHNLRGARASKLCLASANT